MQLVKGILPDTQSTATSVPANAGAGTGIVPTGTDTGTTATTDTSCADAIAKIDDALQFSENLMQADGGRPTLKDIQAVLKALENSLNDDCKINRHNTRDSLMQDREDFGREKAGSATSDGSASDRKVDQGMGRDEYHNGDTAKETKHRDMQDEFSELAIRRTECSECERALYNIVVELQDIFSIGQTAGGTPAGMVNQPSIALSNTTTIS